MNSADIYGEVALKAYSQRVEVKTNSKSGLFLHKCAVPYANGIIPNKRRPIAWNITLAITSKWSAAWVFNLMVKLLGRNHLVTSSHGDFFVTYRLTC